MTHTNKKAFSLIEISIVIVVLAILISFIPDVLQLKDNAKISKVRALTQSAPLQHMDDLIIWYESSMPDSFIESEATENGNISTWYNRAPQSKRINNATQTNAGNQPKYVTNVLNDVIPAILFDGSNDFLNFLGSGLINSDFTVIVVEMRMRGDTNDYYIGGMTQSGYNFHMGYGASTYARFGIYGNATSNFTVAAYSYPIPRINSFRFDKSIGSYFWINGGSSPDLVNGQKYYLQYYNSARLGDTENQHFYYGYIAEVIVFSRAIFDEERQEIERYLGKKYGIIIDP